MTSRSAVIAAAATLLAASSTAFADTKLIHAGELLTVAGESTSRNQTIVIEDDRIVEVRSGFADAAEFLITKHLTLQDGIPLNCIARDQ